MFRSLSSSSLFVTLLFFLLNASIVFAAPWGTPGPFYQRNGVHIVSLSVDMKVPDVPNNFGLSDTIFIWPAVQPGSGLQDADPQNIGNGVLVPSLTYGRSCAPGGASAGKSWWISGQYLNVPAQTNDPNFAGCHGGDVMAVEPGELISCTINNVGGSIWTQSCHRPSGQSVSFTIDMQGQQMNWVDLTVWKSSSRVDKLWDFPVLFYNINFKTSTAMPAANCLVPDSGDDFLAQGSRLSADKRMCSLDALVFWGPNADPVTSIPPA